MVLVSHQATIVAVPQGQRAADRRRSKPKTTLFGGAIFTPKRQLRRDMTLVTRQAGHVDMSGRGKPRHARAIFFSVLKTEYVLFSEQKYFLDVIKENEEGKIFVLISEQILNAHIRVKGLAVLLPGPRKPFAGG